MKTQTKKWTGKIVWIILACVILLFAASFLAYVSVYYRADETALGFMRSDDAVRRSGCGHGNPVRLAV